jgi:hypothetical protein
LANSAHAALADEQYVLHPLTLRLIEGLLQITEQPGSRGILDPTLSADVRDARFCIQQGKRADIVRQMCEFSILHHQNSTPLD